MKTTLYCEDVEVGCKNIMKFNNEFKELIDKYNVSIYTTSYRDFGGVVRSSVNITENGNHTIQIFNIALQEDELQRTKYLKKVNEEELLLSRLEISDSVE